MTERQKSSRLQPLPPDRVPDSPHHFGRTRQERTKRESAHREGSHNARIDRSAGNHGRSPEGRSGDSSSRPAASFTEPGTGAPATTQTIGRPVCRLDPGEAAGAGLRCPRQSSRRTVVPMTVPTGFPDCAAIRQAVPVSSVADRSVSDSVNRLHR